MGVLAQFFDKNKTIRLESGNHRIKTAIKNGYTHLPVAFLICKQSIFHENNGVHTFKVEGIVNFEKLTKCPYPYQVNPKEIMDNKYFI